MLLTLCWVSWRVPCGVQVPLDLAVHSIEWAPSGRALLLVDRSSHCIAYLTTE